MKAATGIEALKNCSNGIDIELVGIEPLKNISEPFKLSLQSGGIKEESRLINVIGIDKDFFYIIETIKSNQVCYYERGIASVSQVEDKYFLNRKKIFLTGKNHFECSVKLDDAPNTICCEHSVLYSTIPPTYIEALSSEQSVLCSSDSCLPNPIHLPKDSILARFNDNIESVSFTDDRLLSKIVNAISTFGKQLKLKTSKLSLKRVESEIIDMIPSSDVKAKKGSLYYDESDDTLKLYDGQKWKTIAFVKE